MVTVVRVLTGVLLLAHGLVHLLYLASDVPEFALDRSWLLPQAARRPVALALIAATVVAFALVALAVWGTPGLAAVWPALTLAACLVSALLLTAYFDPRLLAGLGIDAALAAAALLRPGWVGQLVG